MSRFREPDPSPQGKVARVAGRMGPFAQPPAVTPPGSCGATLPCGEGSRWRPAAFFGSWLLGLALAFPALAQQKAPAAQPQKLNLGRAAHAEELKAWDISVLPDGRGLPVGKGTAKKGEELFVEKCAACHGEFGEGVGRWPALAGGNGTLKNDRPDKTVGSFWPASTTLFDYLRRAMPYGNAQSLEADELYALSAYVLHMSDVIKDPEFEVSEKNFAGIKMPNGGGFYDDDREVAEKRFWRKDVCMKDCKKDAPKVTGRAMVIDVTPDSKTAPRVE